MLCLYQQEPCGRRIRRRRGRRPGTRTARLRNGADHTAANRFPVLHKLRREQGRDQDCKQSPPEGIRQTDAPQVGLPQALAFGRSGEQDAERRFRGGILHRTRDSESDRSRTEIFSRIRIYARTRSQTCLAAGSRDTGGSVRRTLRAETHPRPYPCSARR